MMNRAAPPYSSRRLALQLARHALRSPGTFVQRVNGANLAHWRDARALHATCNICGHQGPLLDEMLDLQPCARHHIRPARETLRCRGCGSKMRDRVVAAALLDMLFDRGIIAPTIEALADVLPTHIRILDTDANSRIAQRLRHHPGFHRSLFLPGHANGENLGEERLFNIDLQEMPFRDRYFHVIITSDVMEHVRLVDRAHREIARCLRPIGEYIFTVPYDETLPRTWLLVDPETDEDLVPEPHFHRDPEIRRQGIRSYRVFGPDLVDDLAAAGLTAEFVPITRPEIGVFDGDVFRAALAQETSEHDGRALPGQAAKAAAQGGNARPSASEVVASS